MPRLFDDIRTAVSTDLYAVTDHADNRLRERGIEWWQVVGEIDDAWLMALLVTVHSIDDTP